MGLRARPRARRRARASSVGVRAQRVEPRAQGERGRSRVAGGDQGPRERKREINPNPRKHHILGEGP